jgi:4,5-DOPA dioxygenase extradiol
MTLMQRRHFLGSRAASLLIAGTLGATMSTTEAATGLSALGGLAPTPRMPVLFIGHGSPMNAIEDNAWRRSWQVLGKEFGAKYPKPQAILCISAHFLTRGWWITAMAKPKTIHDFGGFPQALFDQQYPAPGAPALAAGISASIFSPRIGLDDGEWGLDHGTWSVLKPMFPLADIPVLQLSMDYDRPAAEHYALGQRLKALRERGVLIVGSGNIVHNLRALRQSDAAPYDWAVEFDKVVGGQLQGGNLGALQDFQKLGAVAQQAHPTHEHYLPLLYAAGAADAKEPMAFFNNGFQGQSISMRSVVWS